MQRLTEEAIATNAEVASKLNLPLKQARNEVRPAATATDQGQEASDPNQRVTRSMRAPTQQVQRVSTAASPRVEMNIATADQVGKKKVKQHRKRRSAVRLTPSKAVPAGNTRAQKKQVVIRAVDNILPTTKSTCESRKSKNEKVTTHAPNCLFAKQNQNCPSSYG